MEKYFITKYRQRIDFIEGYFELFQKEVANYDNLLKQIYYKEDYLKERKQGKEDRVKMKYHAFLSRHARAAKMKEILNKYKFFTFQRCLDIGTGHAIIPRLIKAFGIAQKAYGLDPTDRSYYLSSKEILKYEKQIKRRQRLNRLFNGFSDRETSTFNEFGFVLDEKSFQPKIVSKKIDLDGLIQKDIYQHTDNYDLVTIFTCAGYFDLNKILKKVSELLTPNGLLFIYDSLWWYIVNSTQLVGHFPFAPVRLDQDDWQRYCRQFHPEKAETMIKLFNYFHQSHPTVSQYIDWTSKFDLTLVGYERCIHNQVNDPRSKLSPNYLETFFQESYLQEVLSNIHQFRPDVRIEDLQTSHAFMVFQKRPYNQKLIINEEFKIQSTIKKLKAPTIKAAFKNKIKHIIK